MSTLAALVVVPCVLVFCYAFVGLLIPKLPFIRSRKRAAVACGVTFLLALASAHLWESSLTPQERNEIEQRRLADERKTTEQRAAEQQLAAERKPRVEQEAAVRKEAERQAQEEREFADKVKEELEIANQAYEIVFLDALISDYEDNELAADAKYKGRTIRVSGVVSHVANDILNQPYVTIGRGEELEIRQVQCVLIKSSVDRATALRKGQRITVRGVVSGLMMNVLLNKCEIVD